LFFLPPLLVQQHSIISVAALCTGPSWERVHGEFVQLWYATKPVTKVVVARSGRTDDGTTGTPDSTSAWSTSQVSSSDISTGGRSAALASYTQQQAALRIFEQERLSKAYEEIAQREAEQTTVEQDGEASAASPSPPSTPPSTTGYKNTDGHFFRYTTNSVLAASTTTTSVSSSSRDSWIRFFQSEEVAEVESLEDGASECWPGVLSLSLARLLYTPPTSGVEHGAANGERKVVQSRGDETKFFRVTNLLDAFRDYFGESLPSLPWDQGLNTGWPVPDLLAEASEVLEPLDLFAIKGLALGGEWMLERKLSPHEQYEQERLATHQGGSESELRAGYVDQEGDHEQEGDQQAADPITKASKEERSFLQKIRKVIVERQRGEAYLPVAADLVSGSNSVVKRVRTSGVGAEAMQLLLEKGDRRDRSGKPFSSTSARISLMARACAHLVLALQNLDDLTTVSDRVKSASLLLKRFVNEHYEHQSVLPTLVASETGGFPFWRLLALVDQRWPRVRSEAIVIVGRMDRLEILSYYLQTQLRINGGCLDRVNFVVHNAVKEEIDFIQHLVREHPDQYQAPAVYGKKLAKFYSVAKTSSESSSRHTIFVKIDDDIVFMSRNAVKDLVLEKFFRDSEVSMVSANIVNHAILSAVHNELGAVPDEYGPIIYPQWEAEDEKILKMQTQLGMLNEFDERTRAVQSAAEEDETFRKSQEAKKKKQQQGLDH
ncbi:unnamed protein product, partial [Amoebophrya sp. A25]